MENKSVYIGQSFRSPKGQPREPAWFGTGEDAERNFFDLLYAPELGQNQKTANMMRGIARISPVGKGKNKRVPFFLILSSSFKSGTPETPWQDFFDPDHGVVQYGGDNKHRGVQAQDAIGNKQLLEVFDATMSGDPDDRAKMVPCVFMERPEAGKLIFHGAGVPVGARRVTQSRRLSTKEKKARIDAGEPVPPVEYFSNYVFDFIVFDMAREGDAFNWGWLDDRRNPKISCAEMDARAPATWREWMHHGPAKIDRCRRAVSRLNLVNPKTQEVKPDDQLYPTLKTIYSFYENKKHHFEGLAYFVLKRVLVGAVSESGGADHIRFGEGWVTRGTGDGGVDFVARLDVGRTAGAGDLSTTKVVLLGQAKCEKLDAPTGGNHVARTVARLRRGWIGAYVTTSYFSTPVQREVIEDRYPVLLINGRRVATEARAMAATRDISVGEFLERVNAQFEEMLAARVPEQVLRIEGSGFSSALDGVPAG